MRYPIRAAFINRNPAALFVPLGGGAPSKLKAGDRVAPPGDFETEDAAQAKRLQAALCLGEARPTAKAPAAPTVTPPAAVLHPQVLTSPPTETSPPGTGGSDTAGTAPPAPLSDGVANPAGDAAPGPEAVAKPNRRGGGGKRAKPDGGGRGANKRP